MRGETLVAVIISQQSTPQLFSVSHVSCHSILNALKCLISSVYIHRHCYMPTEVIILLFHICVHSTFYVILLILLCHSLPHTFSRHLFVFIRVIPCHQFSSAYFLFFWYPITHWMTRDLIVSSRIFNDVLMYIGYSSKLPNPKLNHSNSHSIIHLLKIFHITVNSSVSHLLKSFTLL